MILKKIKRKKKFQLTLFYKIYFFISLFFLLVGILIFLNTGPWINSKKEFLNRIYFNGINNYSKIFEISLKGITSFFHRYEEINLNLSYENVLLIEKDRKKLIEETNEGFRSQSHTFVEVPASMNYQDKKIPIKIRLKGDRATHYNEKEKSSYKVEIRGDERIMGMRKFSFMKPRARNYIHEWLFHELSGEGNLIKLNYDFIKLKINGNSLGLYVIEENFDKDLVERSKRRNGPIFSLNEEFSDNIYESKLELFNKQFWKKRENLVLSNFAKKKLESFINGKSNLNEVFDLDKWAWFFSVADLTYTYHGVDPRNVKFFYNPLSGLFEPIPYDGHRFARNYSEKLINFDHRNSFEISSFCQKNKCENQDIEKWIYSFFFKKDGSLNNEFYSKYMHALQKITQENFLNNFFDKNKKKIDKINAGIYSDYFLIDNVTYGKFGPGLYYFSKDDIFLRSKNLKRKIKKNLKKISVSEDEESIKISNFKQPNNISLKPTELICEERNNQNNLTKNISLNLNIKYLEDFKINKKNLELDGLHCQIIKFQDNLNLRYYTKKIELEFNKFLNLEKNKNKFLEYFDRDKNLLTLKSSKIIIDSDVYIPKNHIVKIFSGQSIILKNNAFIISDSNWIVGDSKKKTFITGENDNFGGGIVIKNVKSKSEFYNTEFKFLSGVEKRFSRDNDFKKDHLLLTQYDISKKNSYIYRKSNFKEKNFIFSNDFLYTGAINFYNTNLKIKNCSFSKIDSEDALNVVSSNFELNTLKFEENSSDSIDIDFGNGEIKNIDFKYIGNDALDFSGSNVKVNKIDLFNVGDKLISVGEESNLEIKNLIAQNSYIGIASKDSSKAYIKNVKMNNVKIPFASYQKKKAYNYGFIDVKEPISIKNFYTKTLKDFNSVILINSLKIDEASKNINQIVYEKKIDLLKND